IRPPGGGVPVLGSPGFNPSAVTIPTPVQGLTGPLGQPMGVPVNPLVQTTPGLSAQITQVDPLVRSTQLGYTPVGALTNLDLSRGTGFVGLPGVGPRAVRVVGSVIQTAAGPAVRVVDAASGIQFVALVPNQGAGDASNMGPLVSAKVLRVTSDAAILERT